METIKVNCLYNGKKSICEFKQGGIDIQFRTGKMVKFDHLTSINSEGEKINFHGLYYGSLLKLTEVDTKELQPIFDAFKVRTLSHSKIYGTMYKDHALTELKAASKGAEIFDTIIQKRAQAAKKRLNKYL